LKLLLDQNLSRDDIESFLTDDEVACLEIY